MKQQQELIKKLEIKNRVLQKQNEDMMFSAQKS
jgi:hypothetical protein